MLNPVDAPRKAGRSRFSTFVSYLQWVARGGNGSAAVANTFLVKIIILGINLLTGIIAARGLGPGGRGITVAVALWPAIVSGALTFGLPAAFEYRARRAPEERDELFTTAIVLGATAGCIAAAVGAFLVIPHVLHHYSPDAIHFAQGMMVFAPQIMIYNLMNGLLNVRGEFSRSNFLWLVANTATLTVQTVLLLTHRFDPFSNGLAYFSPALIVTSFVAFRVRSSFRWTRGFRRRTKSLASYGIRVYGLELLNTFSGQIDQTLVVGLLSAVSFGLYTTSLNVTRMLNVIQSSINPVLFPKAASLATDEALPLIARAARISLVLTTFGAIGFLIVTPFLVPFFYGEAFASVIPITRVLAIESVVVGYIGVLSQTFMATGRPGLITILQVAGLLTSVPLMLLLIPRLGLLGAALALLGSSTIRGALLLYCFPMVLKRPVPRLLPMLSDARYVIGRLRHI